MSKGRGKKEGAITESPVDRQDQPRIYTIRDHGLEVLMHPDVLELHAVRVVHTPHGDERQLHLKVRVRCGQEELMVDVLVDTGAQVSLVRRGKKVSTRTGPCYTPSTISCHSYGLASHQVLHDLALSCTISHTKY